MNISKNIITFLPLIISIIAAVITYFFGQRSKNLDKFYKQTQKSLTEVTSPIYHELKAIKVTNLPEKREKLLQQFFEKYLKESTNIYHIGNRFVIVIEYFYNLYDKFCEFMRTRNQNDWNEFWLRFESFRFESFFVMIEEEYWKTFEITYSDYKWHQYNMTKNIFFRVWNSVVRFLFDFSKVVVAVTGFLVYLTMYDKIQVFITEKNIFPSNFFNLSLTLLFLSVMFFGVMGIINSYQLAYIQSGESFIRKLIKNKFHGVVKKWDVLWEKILSLPLRNKEIDKIPPMYEKKDIDI